MIECIMIYRFSLPFCSSFLFRQLEIFQVPYFRRLIIGVNAIKITVRYHDSISRIAPIVPA